MLRVFFYTVFCGCKLKRDDGIISELVQKNKENEFVVSTGKNCFAQPEK